MNSKLNINLSGVLLAVTLLVLAANIGYGLIIYARHAILAVSFPYPLDYGEGPVLDQLLRLTRGETIYRATVSTPPYTVTLYPPLYLLIQVPFVHIVGLALWYGRVISIASLVLAAIFMGLTLFHLSRNLLAAVTSSLLMFVIPYFVNLSVLDRVDTFALALSWGGLYILVRGPERHSRLIAAGLLFSAAIFTQQTYLLAAPVTALTWLILTRHARRVVVLLAVTGVTSGFLYVGMNILTGGGFAYNLLTLKTNPWIYPQVAGKLIELGLNAYFLGLIALAFFIGERLDTPTRTWPFVLPYFMTALLVSLSVGKTGSSDQTMLELAAALCLASGAAIAWMKNRWARIVLFILLSLQVNALISWTNTNNLPVFANKLANQADIGKIYGIIRGADGPILADEFMGLIPLAGKGLYYEPFEFNQLARTGQWNPTPFIQDITTEKFSSVFIYFPSDFHITQSRWSDQLIRIISQVYNRSEIFADTLVFIPKK